MFMVNLWELTFSSAFVATENPITEIFQFYFDVNTEGSFQVELIYELINFYGKIFLWYFTFKIHLYDYFTLI